MPQLFKLVVFPLRGAEDMHDDITIIKQEPPGVERALMVMRHDAFFLQAVLDFIIDGTNLPLAVTGTDYKIVRKSAHIADIQQHDIACLLITGDFYGPSGYFYRFQTSNLRSGISKIIISQHYDFHRVYSIEVIFSQD